MPSRKQDPTPAVITTEIRRTVTAISGSYSKDTLVTMAAIRAAIQKGWGEWITANGIHSDASAYEAACKAGMKIVVRNDVSGRPTYGEEEGMCPPDFQIVGYLGNALLIYDGDDNALEVLAPTRVDAQQAARTFLQHFPAKVVDAGESEAVFEFAFRTVEGTSRFVKKLAAGTWAEIATNYPDPCRATLDDLTRMTAGPDGGRLALLRGPTGTGKTYFLLSLAREWKKWACFTYVMDPERFFGDPGYMMEIVLRVQREDRGWNVLVMEDVDEFIRESAKATMGQGVSRLLNLAEGLIGSGLRTILFMTTNEKLANVHPAIVRPGRAFVDVEFDAFTWEKAKRWLAAHEWKGDINELDPRTYSLAELYRLKSAKVEKPRVQPALVATPPEGGSE